MKKFPFLFVAAFIFSCKNKALILIPTPETNGISSEPIFTKPIKDSNSWTYFLQHLPEKEGPVIDHRGRTVDLQSKHFSVVDYDIGSRDLQQCADALIRLRAEYLYGQKRWHEIGFHFTSGHYYSYSDYCKGKIPVVSGNRVHFTNTLPQSPNKKSLRQYLDIVFAYAGTISLAKELSEATEFAVGTVVISPGSPGHCFIITDEAELSSGEKVYKLVEGFTPAQSIYVLRNTRHPSLGFWHHLNKGVITTASYTFTSYQLKRFE